MTITRRPLLTATASLLLAGSALLVGGCSATDVVGSVQQCAEVGAALAKVSVVAAGGQASGQDLTAARDALEGVGSVPEALTGPFTTLEQAFAEGKGFDDPAVQSAYDEIRAWAETECVPGSLGDLIPGS